MPSANFRLDLLFQRQDSGWSETYYRNAASYDTMGTIAKNLADKRVTLLCNTCQVIGWRITELAAGSNVPSGKTFSEDQRFRGLFGAVDSPPDVRQVAWLVTMINNATKRRKRVWTRGWADDSTKFQAFGNFVIDDKFRNAFDAFANYLSTDGNWLIRYASPPGVDNPKNQVQTVGFTADGTMRLILKDDPSPFFAGNRVKVQKYKGTFGSQVNGYARVINVVPETKEILLAKRSETFAGQEQDGGGAYVIAENYSFDAVQRVEPTRPTTHATGAAFFRQRGRRSKKPPSLITPVAVP